MRPSAAAFLAVLAALGVVAVSPHGPRCAHADEADGPRDVPASVAALADRDPATRAQAASFLGSRRVPAERRAAVVAMIPRLDDPDAAVRKEVVLALTALAERAVARCLAFRLVREGDPEVVAALLLGIGALGGGEDVERVLPYADHTDPTVQTAAVTALGDLGGESAHVVVLRAALPPADPFAGRSFRLDDESAWNRRAAAILALARCGGPDDVGIVLNQVRVEDGLRFWLVRTAVARLVAALDPDPLPLLRRLALDPDPRVATTAAEGIGRRGATEDVQRLLEHERADVRAAAASAVARVPVGALVPRLRAMARLDADRPVRWAAARGLFRLGDPLGDDLVLEGVGSREPAVWTEAVALLAERTGARHGRDAAAWRAALARARGGP